MRKIIIGGFVAAIGILGSVNMVTGQGEPVPFPNEVRKTPGMLTNMIDGVDVPYEILEYIQMRYEGYAVIKAEKTKRNDKDVYKLYVDRDTMDKDYGFGLLFDMDWKLIGEEKTPPPPQPKPQVTENKKQQPQESTEGEREERRDDKPDEKPRDEEEKPPAEDEPPADEEEPDDDEGQGTN